MSLRLNFKLMPLGVGSRFVTKPFFFVLKKSFSDASSITFAAALDILREKENITRQKISKNSPHESVHGRLIFSDPKLFSDWKLNKIELKIPKFSEMGNAEWVRNRGPQITRLQARTNNLIPDILPDETEVMINMRCLFDENVVGRGNFILPEQCIEAPTVQFSTSSTEMFRSKDGWYSLIFFDSDFPGHKDETLHQKALWMVVNLECPSNNSETLQKPLALVNPHTIDKNSPNQLLNYLPPHPARGTGMCRYVFVLLSHQTKLPGDIQGIFDSNFNNFSNSNNRIFDISDLIRNFNLQVASYSWFTSTWTKHISALFDHNQPLHGLKEYAYGTDVKGAVYLPPPNRFQYT